MEQKAYPTYLQSLGLILILFLFGILAALVVMPFTSIKGTIGMWSVYLISFTFTIIAAMRIRNDFAIKIGKIEPGLLLISCVTILCFQIAIEPITNLFPMPESILETFDQIREKPLFLVFVIVIAAPVLEELLFRGIVLEGLIKNYKPLPAILFTSLLFALIHGNLAQGIGAYFIGLVVGWIYWKTQNLVYCIAIHFVNNLAATVPVLFLSKEDFAKSTSELLSNQFEYYLLIAGCAIIAIFGIWLLKKSHDKMKFVDETSSDATNQV